MLVPVVVRDKNGQVIGDLHKEDFTVLDDGKPRAISSIMVEKRLPPRFVPNTNPQSSTTGSNESKGTFSAPRFVVFLFDDMHMSFTDLAAAKSAASRLLSTAFEESDMVGIVSISGAVNSGLIRDQAKLQEAIASMRPHSVYRADGADCPNIDFYQADQIQNKHDPVALAAAVQQVFSCSPSLDTRRDQDMAERIAQSAAMRAQTLGHQDVQATYAAMAEFVRRVAALPGQRTIVLISSGFLSLSQDERTFESRVMDLAAQSNVVISALDARGLYTSELTASERSQGSMTTMQLKADYYRSSMRANDNVMAELADATGGTYFHNSNDLDAGLKAVTTFPECVYTLELTLDGVKQNGSFHRLSVKVHRDGAQSRARHGYFAPKLDKKTK